MNLDVNPMPRQLRELIARCDDATADHVLWVKKTGEVQVSAVATELPAARFQQIHPDMKMRYETFRAGNEYVGPEAAADDEWIAELFDSLQQHWRNARVEPGVVFLEVF